MVLKTFNLDEETYRKFSEFCRENGISMSKQINLFMSYSFIISKQLNKIFSKISRKDKIQFEILTRKIEEILKNPYQFKPLRENMAG